MKLSGWGRFPQLDVQLHHPRDLDRLRDLVLGQPKLIARGNGRAYGDSALNATATVQMGHLNRLLAFDAATGQVVAEAGATLGDLIQAFLPLGWFPAVTPGTKYVTLGGAIAADVHGKNHHRDGSFRSCVDWIDVMGADGQITRCAPDVNPLLFDHTLGGMGLTGIILRAALRLRSVETAWIGQTTQAAPHLRAVMQMFEQAQGASYSVAWIDALAEGPAMGRALVMLGEHARRDDLPANLRARPLEAPTRTPRSLPFDLPSGLLNRHSMRAFNALYYRAGQRQLGKSWVDWDRFFYPLDALLGWNRAYGRAGFAQFQCVLPLDTAQPGLTALLRAIADSGCGACLAVLKRFGAQTSAFSFPMEGYTLALDFAVNPAMLALLDRLDQITLDHQGRFYLAKDSRMRADVFHRAESRLPAFQAARRALGAQARFCSAQSERLAL